MLGGLGFDTFGLSDKRILIVVHQFYGSTDQIYDNRRAKGEYLVILLGYFIYFSIKRC